MYARSVDGQKLTFTVSGMLWNRSLVMMDKETKSLWSHILGEAKRGKLKGTQLDQLPSLMTDWQTWKRLHPETSVITQVRNSGRTDRKFERRFYQRRQRRIVFGVVLGIDQKAWLMHKLPAMLNDKVGEDPVLLKFDRDSFTARLFDRRIDGKVLTFERKDGKVVDNQTASIWDPLVGKATSGPLEGKQLEALPAIESFAGAWKVFHPDSSYGP